VCVFVCLFVTPCVGVWRSDVAAPVEPTLTGARRLRLMLSLLPFMLPLALVYFAEYLINQSVDATWNFKHFSFAETGTDQVCLSLSCACDRVYVCACVIIVRTRV
jgi:hypothetical protein